jgi:hypothetical protein
VLRYVATYSPESSAESRFCLSRPFRLFGAVHEQARAQSLVDLEGDRHAEFTHN